MTLINYSAIIPTIGGPHLEDVVKNLLDSSHPPAEILICFPNNDLKMNILQKLSDKIKIVNCKIKCQVKQREYGVSISTSDVVLQIDDDVIVEKKSIENLFYFLKDDNALSPVFFYMDTRDPIHLRGLNFSVSLINLFKNLIYLFFHNVPFGIKKSGMVSKQSLSFGVASFSEKNEFIETDWLPGGLVLTMKKNFVFLKNYYLKGKAYTEDILNSYYRKKNNIRHCVVLNSYAFTDNINKSDDKSNSVYVSQKIEEFKARKFYVKTVKGNIVKFYIWWYGYFLSGLIRNVKSNIRKNLSKIRK